MREGNPGGVLGLGLLLESHLFSLNMFCTHLSMFMLAIGFFPLICFLLTKFFVFQMVLQISTPPFRTSTLSINIDKILKADVFVHSDDQLRVAHLILGYTLL